MSFSSNLKTFRILASQLDNLEIYLLSGDVPLDVYIDCLHLLSRVKQVSNTLDGILPCVYVEMDTPHPCGVGL